MDRQSWSTGEQRELCRQKMKERRMFCVTGVLAGVAPKLGDEIHWAYQDNTGRKFIVPKVSFPPST